MDRSSSLAEVEFELDRKGKRRAEIIFHAGRFRRQPEIHGCADKERLGRRMVDRDAGRGKTVGRTGRELLHTTAEDVEALQLNIDGFADVLRRQIIFEYRVIKPYERRAGCMSGCRRPVQTAI